MFCFYKKDLSFVELTGNRLGYSYNPPPGIEHKDIYCFEMKATSDGDNRLPQVIRAERVEIKENRQQIFDICKQHQLGPVHRRS